MAKCGLNFEFHDCSPGTPSLASVELYKTARDCVATSYIYIYIMYMYMCICNIVTQSYIDCVNISLHVYTLQK